MMIRCSSVNKRPRCGHNIEVVIVRICLNDLISKMKFIGHVLRSYDLFHAKVMLLIGLVIMTLHKNSK